MSRKSTKSISDHPVTDALSHSIHLRQYRHHVFPGLNTHLYDELGRDVENATNFYQSPPAIIRKPIPCLSTTYVPNRGIILTFSTDFLFLKINFLDYV